MSNKCPTCNTCPKCGADAIWNNTECRGILAPIDRGSHPGPSGQPEIIYYCGSLVVSGQFLDSPKRDCALGQLAQSEQKRKELREALEYYADVSNEWAEDTEIARAALKADEEE